MFLLRFSYTKALMSIEVQNARDVAVLALTDRKSVATAMEKLLAAHTLSGPERALAREITLGLVRRRATVRAVLRNFLAEPGKALPGHLSEILQVAIYQILFLDRVPEFAAVNEAVGQATRFDHERQRGLINAVLRNLTRALSPLERGPVPIAADVIPAWPGLFRRSKVAIFPDPKTNADGFVAQAYSLPPALVQRWMRQYKPLDRVVAIAAHADARAPLIVRVNALKATVPQVLEKLLAASVDARPHANGLSVVIDHGGSVEELPGFAQGLYQPQDATATEAGRVTGQLAAEAMKRSQQGAVKVLDFCAAPGTKTTHIAEQTGDAAAILALDISNEKLQKIRSNCARLGVSNVQTMLAEQAGGLELAGYDVVLADVPCSNTGVLARRPEARWRFTEEALARLVKDQQFLAAAAGRFVAPGGHLVYSTCSIEEEEGPQIVRHLLKVDGRLELVEERLTLPGGAEDAAQWHDGGYLAVLKAKH